MFDRSDFSEAVRVGICGAIVIATGLISQGVDIAKWSNEAGMVTSISIVVLSVMVGTGLNELTRYSTQRCILWKSWMDALTGRTIQGSIAKKQLPSKFFGGIATTLFWLPQPRCKELVLGVNLRINQLLADSGELSGGAVINDPFAGLDLFLACGSDRLSKNRPILLQELSRCHDRFILYMTVSAALWVCGVFSAFAAVAGAIWGGFSFNSVVFGICSLFAGVGLKFVARQFWERELILLAVSLDHLHAEP